MSLEHIEHLRDKKETPDKKRIDYWKELAEIFSETQSALESEKTKMLDQKRIEWWKEEAEKR